MSVIKPLIVWTDSGNDEYFHGMVESLTELMKEVNPTKEWYVSVTNLGWRKRNGVTTITADDGETLLREVLPKTECSFKIYREADTLIIRNSHHDSPCGGETYRITKLSEDDDD